MSIITWLIVGGVIGWFATTLMKTNGCPGREFDGPGSEISNDWAASRGGSSLRWEQARYAARDAWNRIRPSGLLCA